MSRRSTIPAVVILAALAACSSNPPPAAPAPTPAPAAMAPAPAPAPAAAPAAAIDVSGTWDFTVDAGGQMIPGEMIITRSGATYGGTVSPQGMSTVPIRTVTLNGLRVLMVVDTPDGEAQFEMTLAEGNRVMSGTVAFSGQSMGINARKR